MSVGAQIPTVDPGVSTSVSAAPPFLSSSSLTSLTSLPSLASLPSSSSRSPVLLVLIDGVGDVALSGQALSEVGLGSHTKGASHVPMASRTPLSCALTPVLDVIARVGANGLMDPVEPGLACGSDTAHLSLFGYDPRVVYRGRGAFESLGAGMDMKPGDIAFKSNFAVIDEDTGVVVKRRVDRVFEEAGPVLCGALDGLGVEVDGGRYRIYCRYATEHRCGVVIRQEVGGDGLGGDGCRSDGQGVGLSDQIEGTDPLKDGLPLRKSVAWDVDVDADISKSSDGDEVCRRAQEQERARRERTARVVNSVSDRMRGVLRLHPLNKEREMEGKAAANVVLLRGCGSLLDLPTFEEKHGVRACMVAPTKIIAGLGKSVGMDVLAVDGATGDYRSDFRNKALRMSQALGGCQDSGDCGERGYGFGFLHIKAVDDAGHDRNASLKVACLEVVDAMLGQLIKLLRDSGNGKIVLGITGDHSTPVEYGDHSHEPVPIVMCTVNDVVDAMSADVLDAIDMDALPLPEDVLHLSPDERIDRHFPWKRSLVENDAPEAGFSRIRGLPKHDGVTRFGETECAKGCLGRFPGSHTVPTLFRFGESMR